MAQARSNIPTIAEKVSQAHVGDPKVRAYAYSEYVGSKPGYVSSNPRAGSEWGALANTLDRFYRSSTTAYTKYKENELEEGIASGVPLMDAAKERLGEKANRTNFKKLVEMHPDLAPDNPWAEIGYEKSRLRELAIEARSGFQAFADESGLYNEKDPEKVANAVNSWFTKFREDTGLKDYDNKLLMARTFSPLEAEIRKSFMVSYDTNRRNTRQIEYSSQIAREGATILATALKEKKPVDLTTIENLFSEASEHGLLDKNLPETALSLCKLYYANTGDENIFDMMDAFKVKGVPLSSYTDAATWRDNEQTKALNQRVTDEKRYKADLKEFKEKRVKEYAYTLAKGLDIAGSYDAQRSALEEQAGKKFSDFEWDNITSEAGELNRKWRLRDKTENETVRNQIDTANEIAEILATSDDPEAELTARWGDTRNTAFEDALKELKKSDAKTLKEEAKYKKEYCKGLADTLVDNHASKFNVDNFGIVRADKTKMFEEKRRIRRELLAAYSALSTEEEKRINPDGHALTYNQREAIKMKVEEQLGKMVENGWYTRNYTADTFKPTLKDANTPKPPYWGSVLEPYANQPDKVALINKYIEENQLTVANAPIPLSFKKNYMDLFDVGTMALNNVSDFSTASLNRFIKPETGFKALTVSPDGKSVIVDIDEPDDEKNSSIRNYAIAMFSGDLNIQIRDNSLRGKKEEEPSK
jgi:hypothetical protein